MNLGVLCVFPTKKCKVTVEDPKLSETSLELEVEDEDDSDVTQ